MMKLTTKLRIPRPFVSSWVTTTVQVGCTLTLLSGQDFPLGHNDIIEDLQANI